MVDRVQHGCPDNSDNSGKTHIQKAATHCGPDLLKGFRIHKNYKRTTRAVQNPGRRKCKYVDQLSEYDACSPASNTSATITDISFPCGAIVLRKSLFTPSVCGFHIEADHCKIFNHNIYIFNFFTSRHTILAVSHISHIRFLSFCQHAK